MDNRKLTESSTNDSGPAFPSPVYRTERIYDLNGNQIIESHISIRDYFAAKAIQGILAALDFSVAGVGDVHIDSIAKASYALADAMMKQREVKP